MKKLFYILILILYCGISYAKGWYYAGGAAADYCSGCPDSTAGGDLLCERCDSSSNGVCNWSSGTHEYGTITWNAACDESPSLGCSDIQTSYCVEYEKTSTTSGNLRDYYDTGSTQTTAYYQFYVKIISEGLADGEVFAMTSMAEYGDAGYASFYVAVTQVSGSLYFRLGYHDSSDWLTDDGGSAISTDVWYGVRVYYDTTTTPDRAYWWVNYSGSTWTDEGANTFTADRAARYVVLGDTGAKTSLIKYQITGMKIDDDTMPSACTGR